MKLINKSFCISVFLLSSTLVFAQSGKQRKIALPVSEDVAWWSGISNHGQQLPVQNGDEK